MVHVESLPGLTGTSISCTFFILFASFSLSFIDSRTNGFTVPTLWGTEAALTHCLPSFISQAMHNFIYHVHCQVNYVLELSQLKARKRFDNKLLFFWLHHCTEIIPLIVSRKLHKLFGVTVAMVWRPTWGQVEKVSGKYPLKHNSIRITKKVNVGSIMHWII